MSARDQWEKGRREGMAFCIRFLEDGHTQEELKEEIKRRGAYGIPIGITKQEEDDFCARTETAILDSVMIMSMFTLHDLWGMGRKRLEDFKKAYNEKTEVLLEQKGNWQDIFDILEEECGMKMNVRWRDGLDPTRNVDPMEH